MNFSEDRMLMATCSKDGYAKLWTMDDYECIKELLGGKRVSTRDFCVAGTRRTDP